MIRDNPLRISSEGGDRFRHLPDREKTRLAPTRLLIHSFSLPFTSSLSFAHIRPLSHPPPSPYRSGQQSRAVALIPSLARGPASLFGPYRSQAFPLSRLAFLAALPRRDFRFWHPQKEMPRDSARPPAHPPNQSKMNKHSTLEKDNNTQPSVRDLSTYNLELPLSLIDISPTKNLYYERLVSLLANANLIWNLGLWSCLDNDSYPTWTAQENFCTFANASITCRESTSWKTLGCHVSPGLFGDKIR
jgi:hypothetical protein